MKDFAYLNQWQSTIQLPIQKWGNSKTMYKKDNSYFYKHNQLHPSVHDNTNLLWHLQYQRSERSEICTSGDVLFLELLESAQVFAREKASSSFKEGRTGEGYFIGWRYKCIAHPKIAWSKVCMELLMLILSLTLKAFPDQTKVQL